MKTPSTSDLIRMVREEHGLTKAQLAELLNVGVPAVYQYEKGLSEISIQKYRQLAEMVGLKDIKATPSKRDSINKELRKEMKQIHKDLKSLVARIAAVSKRL